MLEKMRLWVDIFRSIPAPNASYQHVLPCHSNKGPTVPTQELVDHYRISGSHGSAYQVRLKEMELSYGGEHCKQELGLVTP